MTPRNEHHAENQRKKNEEENEKTKKTEMEKVRREGMEVRNGLGWNIYSCERVERGAAEGREGDGGGRGNLEATAL